MPQIRTDGPVIEVTGRNIISGLRGDRLSREALDGVVEQATAFVQQLVDNYKSDVAQGEVGLAGSGLASDLMPVAERCPTALLYGRVQSGKTASMIASTALAIDNGFRTVIVLTANNLALVRQTANRFKALGGPHVLSTATEGDQYEWEGQEDDLREDLRDRGMVLVCAKDTTHLRQLIGLLQELDAAAYPALIFDDEADTATPDTTLAARSAGRPTAPPIASTINRRVVENTAPGEAGDSVREVLPHHVFVQVTATPFVLLLQRPESPMRPRFVHILEAGDGYCGGDDFFGAFDPASRELPAPPLVFVPDAESQTLLAARRGAPAGLSASVAFFLLAAAAIARLQNGGQFPAKGYKYLAHTSPRMEQHDHVMRVIQRQLSAMRRILRDPMSAAAQQYFAEAYGELQRSAGLIVPGAALPNLSDLLGTAAEGLQQAEVFKVNATTSGEPEYGPTYNFVVGGNILGRGITIDDLLVTYYLREAQVSQMDTVWQHGRMFGYRREVMPFKRVYLPRRLAVRFRAIHQAETELRAVLPQLALGQPIPISIIAPGTRATRSNALDADAIRVYRPGTQIYPRHIVSDQRAVAESPRRIREILLAAGAPLDERDRTKRFVVAPIATLIELAQLVPVREGDDGRWMSDAVVSTLENISSRYDDRGMLYVRAFTRDDDARLQTGVLAGAEVDMAKTHGRPVLALMYRGDTNHPAYWYPTLFLPNGMPIQVFNADT